MTKSGDYSKRRKNKKVSLPKPIYITIIQLGLMMILLMFIYQKQGDNNQFFTFVFFDKNLE